MTEAGGPDEERRGVSPENTWSAPRGNEGPGDGEAELAKGELIAEAARRKPRVGEPVSWPAEVALRLMCAAGGGTLGYFLFRLLLTQGLYALAIPGGGLGIAAGLYARRRSLPLGIVCAVAALAVGLFAEWRSFPFLADSSLLYFLMNVHHLRLWTTVMLGLGALVGYWGGKGRS